MQTLSKIGTVKQNTAKAGVTFFICQMIFSFAFVGECVAFNIIGKDPSRDACLVRWTTVAALFIPSGIKNNPPPPTPQPQPKVTRRRRTRKSTTSTTATSEK